MLLYVTKGFSLIKVIALNRQAYLISMLLVTLIIQAFALSDAECDDLQGKYSTISKYIEIYQDPPETVDDKCKVKIITQIGDYYFSSFNIDSAVYYYSKAVNLAKENGFAELQASALISQGGVMLNDPRNIKSADAIFDEARAVLSNFPNSKQWSAYYNYRSQLFDVKNEFETSILYLDSTLQTQVRLKDSTNLAATYLNIGNAHLRLNEFDKAIKYLLEALDIKPNQVLGYTYYLIGIAYNAWDGQNELAKSYFQKGIKNVNVKSAKERKLAMMYIALSKSNRKLNLHDEALMATDSALFYASEINAVRDMSEAYCQKGLIYFHNLKQFEIAEKYLIQGHQMAEKLGDEFTIYKNLYPLADVLLKQEKYRAVKKLLPRLEALTEILNTPVQRGHTQRIKMDYYAGTGDYKKAYLNQKAFQEVHDSLTKKEVKVEMASLERKYDSQQKELAILKLKNEKIEEETKAKFKQNSLMAIVFLLLGLMLAGYLVYQNLKKKRNQLAEAHQELTKLNQVKNQLFSIIAHDLRGMIVPFQRVGKILTYHIDKKNYDQTQKLSGELEKNAERLSNMLDNLLHWSMEQLDGYSPKQVLVSANKELQEIIDGVEQHAIYKNTKIELEVPENTELYFDKGAFHVIFRNLIGNALKYTSNGEIKVTCKPHSDRYEFQVNDTGLGIDKEAIHHIFELSNNKSSPGTAGEKGTGLGLNLVQRFVSIHQGTIEVNSQLNKGTSFRLSFPKTV